MKEVQATLGEIGKRLEKARRKMGLSLTQMSRSNPHVGHEDFSLAESGGLTDVLRLTSVVRAYHLSQKETAELIAMIEPAMKKFHTDARNASVAALSADRRVRTIPITQQRGTQRPPGHQLRP